MTQRAKPKAKAKKAPARRRKPARTRSPVQRKATNWLHARVRDMRRGHNVRGTVLGLFGGFFATLLVALGLTGGMGNALRSIGNISENGLLAAGFRVVHIEIVDLEGVEVTPMDRAAVRRALAVEEGEMVFSVNLSKAKERIENIGWVKRARIMRQLPNRLTVVVVEREPFALWQSSGRWQVISKNGNVIVSAKPENYPSLPLTVGKGAPQTLQAFLVQMQDFPHIKAQVHAYVRVSGRRWNLRLNNGTDLMLPARSPGQVLGFFEHDPRASQLLAMRLKRIDARLPGQIYVRPSPVTLPKETTASEPLS
jgi:cell division protein FtsQ